MYIVDCKRTPIGKYGGSLVDTPATELATVVIKKLLNSNPKIKRHINEVIMGNAISAGLGQNPARIAAYNSGLHHSIPACTINKVCGSSLRSIIMGIHAISMDNARIIIAGGMESMSRSPYLLDRSRFGAKIGHYMVHDAMIYDGLFCRLIGEPMGITAEHIAKKFRISRKKQDLYALMSHKKAFIALDRGAFLEEIVPVPVGDSRSITSFIADEQPRKNTSIEALSKLQPGFLKGGTVTAGNACPLNDGAAAVILSSKEFIKQKQLHPMAKIIGYAYVGLDPKYMGLGAYYAAKESLKRAGLKTTDIDLWEINEAFASQSIAVQELLKIDPNAINVNGGAIALGHPIGASGARILTTLVHEMKKRSSRIGLASLCIGGGQGIAIIIENV